MADFREPFDAFEGPGQNLRRRFQDRFGDQGLLPLPATEMMRTGVPAGTSQQLDQPYRFTTGQPAVPKWPQGAPTGIGPGGQFTFGGGPSADFQQFRGPQFDALLQALTNFWNGGTPQQGNQVTGATVAPGLPPGTTTPQASSADDLINAFRNQYILGQPSSNLANPQVYDQAAADFQAIISAMGGDPNLRASIGDARFTNRLQEFIGKGNTLDQSGIINIGNDQTLQSLRNLADFNQPSFGGAAGVGAFPTGGFANPMLGGGRAAGLGGGRAGGRADKFLSSLMRTGGIDPNLMFQVEKSLRESAERTRAAETEALMEGLAGRRITGGGVEAQERGLLSERLAAGINTGLRDFGTALAAQGAQNQLAAAQALMSGQLTRRGQNLSLLQSQMANALRQQEISNNFALGQGGLALQNLALNNDFMNAMIGNRIDLGQFMNAYNAAAGGDVTQMLSLLLGIADTISGGAVDRR